MPELHHDEQQYWFKTLEAFKSTIWPVYKAKGFESIDLAFVAYQVDRLLNGFQQTTFIKIQEPSSTIDRPAAALKKAKGP